MFRITTHDTEDTLVMKLEGCLSGPWVMEARRLWQQLMQRGGQRRIRVDVTAVCHVDREGRKLMAHMHMDGADFLASGCEMPEIVREIARRRVTAHAVVRRS